MAKVRVSGPLRMHFQQSGAKIGVFEQNWANFQRKVGVKFT